VNVGNRLLDLPPTYSNIAYHSDCRVETITTFEKQQQKNDFCTLSIHGRKRHVKSTRRSSTSAFDSCIQACRCADLIHVRFYGHSSSTISPQNRTHIGYLVATRVHKMKSCRLPYHVQHGPDMSLIQQKNLA
jgi:hypothetical protein